MEKYLYTKWDSTQKIFYPDQEKLMDELGQELISSGNVTDSLNQMQQKGLEDNQGERLPGIEEMQEQLHQKKQRLENQTPPSSEINSLEDGEPNEFLSVSDNENPKDFVSSAEAKLTKILKKMDRLEKQLKNLKNCSLEGIDEQLLKEIMGDEAADHLERLCNIPKTLNEAGYISMTDGKYVLTPRGMRKIGQKALQDIFAQLRKGCGGRHHTVFKGTGGQIIEDTKTYESGDDFQVHLQKTIMNAVYRDPTALPVKLKPEDFEVFQRAGLERSATVLMLDLSFSMLARGHFETAKRIAIALDGLIRSQYPKDSLYIVGFSNHARQIKKEDLCYVNWGESDNYTNIQHGLYLARKLLAKERQTNKQVILVTDGEPTAHFENETNFFYQAPPSPRTLQLTLQEVKNCTRQGIVINTFMLEKDKFLTAFVTRMARINKGRVFFTSSDTLGQYLIVDYIANKKRTIAPRCM
jgi:uncharacterized protein with von Willebrand factor type A (vWA) domain